ncbi:MAG: DUF1565 domain-containing protein [Myxococcaceae bacterium]|nr:DUF1565 domain-containing protein [Myxococcaceae bacterium]
MRLALALAVVSCTSPATELTPLPLTAGQLVIAPPAAPAPAELPRLTPCSTGWAERAEAVPTGPKTCDPWPSGSAATCAAGEAHFPGEAGCVRLGPACPSGDQPEGLPATGVRYVRAGALGGTGTSASPFGTITAALTGAPAGTIVAIGKGTYDEAVRVPAQVTLWGACAAETVISPSTPDVIIGAVVALGPGVEVKNLTLSGARPGVVVGVGGASANVEDVAMVNVTGYGIVAAGAATVTARNLTVRGTRQGARGGAALYTERGGRITVTRAALEDNVGEGLVAFGAGSNIDATQVSVLRTQPLANGSLGTALSVTLDAGVAVRQFAFEANVASTVYSATEGTALLEDGVIRDTKPRPSDRGVGNALVSIGRGHVEASRVTMAGNSSMTVYGIHAGSTLKLTDCVVDDTKSEAATTSGGFGVVLLGGARLDATRLAVTRARANGVSVHQPGSTLYATDLTVLDTAGQEDGGSGGDGVVIARGAAAVFKRVRLERNRYTGLATGTPGTTVDVEDLVVRDTRAEATSRSSSGLAVQDGMTLTLRRGLLEQNQLLGLQVIAAELDATDLVVRDTRGESGTGPVGRGAHVQGAAKVKVVRGTFEGNREAGLAAINPGTDVTLEDVVVRGTQKRACVPQCPDEGGSGVAALGGAHLGATRFAVSGNATCGIELGDDGTMDLADGIVETNPIGICVSTDGFDTARLSRNVHYVENVTKLSGGFVPLPSYTPNERPLP